MNNLGIMNEIEINELTNIDAFAQTTSGSISVEYIEDGYYEIDYTFNGHTDFEIVKGGVKAMTRFKEIATEHCVKTVYVDPFYLDFDKVKEQDERRERYVKESEYYDACKLSEYGDNSLMRAYERKYEEVC